MAEQQTISFAPRAWYDGHLQPIEAAYDELLVGEKLLYLMLRAQIETRDLLLIMLNAAGVGKERHGPGLYLPGRPPNGAT